LSWKLSRRFAGPASSKARKFLAALGIMTAVLFTVVILVQGAAGLVLDGCER
jgi:hypothetical protein